MSNKMSKQDVRKDVKQDVQQDVKQDVKGVSTSRDPQKSETSGDHHPSIGE